MNKIDVVKIRCKREMDDFIRLPYLIYQGCPQYVPDMVKDVRNLFDRHRNPAYEFSQIQPFVAYCNEVPVGRIVGIINRKANEKWQTRNVRFSMIEFVDDPSVSKALIDVVCKWGLSLGMDTIQGPLGITDFDKEGMLVEDFHLMGSMNTVYNPDYYPRHMEALGFKKEVDWVQIRVNVPKEVPARYARVAQYVRKQTGLRIIKLTNEDILYRGFGIKVFHLLNEAYQSIFGFSELSPAQMSIYNKYGFRWAETGPQLEDNVRELSQWKPLQPEYVKRRRCYIRPLSSLQSKAAKTSEG